MVSEMMVASGHAALQHAVVYLTLAGAWRYPETELLAAIASGELGEHLGAALNDLDDEVIAAALVAVEPALAALVDEPDRLAGEYTFLFLRQSPAPPYASSYGQDRLLGRMIDLEEIGRYYSAFGYRVAADHPDLPDHIGAELEFVGLLWAKEAYALDRGRDGDAAVCRAAREQFIARHLLSWLPLLQERLGQHARLDYYPALAALTGRLLATEAVAEPAPLVPHVPLDAVDEDSLICPAVPAEPAQE